jgi:hypothetical protein
VRIAELVPLPFADREAEIPSSTPNTGRSGRAILAGLTKIGGEVVENQLLAGIHQAILQTSPAQTEP